MENKHREENRNFDMRAIRTVAVGVGLFFVAALALQYSDHLFAALGLAWIAVMPLLLGCVFAFLVNLIMARLERVYFPRSTKKIVASSRRIVCLIGSFLIIGAVIAVIVNLVLPELKASTGVIKTGVAKVAGDFYGWASQNLDSIMGSIDSASLESLERSFTDLMASLSSGDSSSVVSMLESVFSTAGSILHNVFAVVVALVFCLYILLDKERVVKGANSALDLFMPASAAASVRRAAHVANQAFSRFITGQCIEAVILGTLCAIGMGIFGMPYAVAIGACVGLTALVPVFGAWLGGAIGFLMILTVDPMQAVWFIVFLIVLQQLETHLIYPNVVGASVGLPGIWVFSAVLVGGALFGVLGMFLGVPAVATIRTLAIERATIVRKRRADEKAEEA
ncbi:AI-2E family transporter [Slackia piriformis]